MQILPILLTLTRKSGMPPSKPAPRRSRPAGASTWTPPTRPPLGRPCVFWEWKGFCARSTGIANTNAFPVHLYYRSCRYSGEILPFMVAAQPTSSSDEPLRSSTVWLRRNHSTSLHLIANFQLQLSTLRDAVWVLLHSNWQIPWLLEVKETQL